MKKEPNIVFITSGHSPFSSRLFYKELRSLKKVFSDITIIAPYDKQSETVENIRISGIEKYKSRYYRWPTLLALYKKVLQLQPDILHCHEPDSLLVSCVIKRKSPDIKVIYDCHEFHPYSFTERYPHLFRDLARKLIEKCENFLASKADAVITVNRKLVERFEKCNQAVIELPNYPNLDIIPKNLKKRELFSSPKVRLIYVGGLSVDRGIFKMLEVLRELKKYFPTELKLIGRFSSRRLEKKVFSNMEQFEISNNVKYMGYLSHKETILNLVEADIALFLVNGKDRYKWGEPIKYFEYSAAALPVVITDLPAKRALIEKNKNGILVNSASVNEIVDAIASLINNRVEARRMGERGRKSFELSYNWEKIEPRLLNLYTRLSN